MRSGEPEPAARASIRIDREPDGVPIGVAGLDRAAQRELHVARGGAGRGVVFRLARELRGPLGVRERALEPASVELVHGGARVGRRGARVAGCGKVVGTESRVPRAVPGGSAAVQLPARRAQQRLVHGIADQRVRESTLVPVGHDEPRRFERRHVESRRAQQVAQRPEVEAMAEHRGGLQRVLQACVERLDPPQQQRAHRAR
jgi:hypothetical protein